MVELECENCGKIYEVQPYRKEDSKYCEHKCYSDSMKSVKGNPFKPLTDKSKYWIGFLMADGSVYGNRVSLSLGKKDKDHIHKFKKFLKCDNKIHTNYDDRHSNKMNKISFKSKVVVNYLNNFGIIENKCNGTKVKNLKNSVDFWRGMVDGDGYLSIVNNKTQKSLPKVGLVGLKNICNDFMNFVKNICKTKATVNNLNSSYTFRTTGKYAVKVINKLYSSNNVSLERKNKTAKKIMEMA